MNWHSVKEAAPLIGLNENAVYLLVESKRLGHRRVGIRKGTGRIQISDDHVAAFLESCEVPAAMEHARPPKATASRPRVKPARKPGDCRPLCSDGQPREFF